MCRQFHPPPSCQQHRSVFATRCLVDVGATLHSRGVHPDAPSRELALARLAPGGGALGDAETELLASWVVLVLMTLDEVGASRSPSAPPGVPPAGDGGPTAAGMRGFVRHTVSKFSGGGGAQRLLMAQAVADTGGRVGSTARVMQQNSRIIVLTLDAARAAGTPLARPLDALEAALRSGDGENGDDDAASDPVAPAFATPVGYAAGVLPPGPGDPEPTPEAVARGRAATLLLAFLGARLGSEYSADAFVAAAAAAYRSGATATQALAPLTPAELASAGGDAATPVDPAAAAEAGSALLNTWTSIVYMTMAQLGVPHDAAGEGAGWAFAGASDGDSPEAAHGLAAVVSGALARIGAVPGSFRASGLVAGVRPDAGAGAPPPRDDDDDAPPTLRADTMVRTEDGSLASTSPTVALWGEALDLALSTAEHVAAHAAKWGLEGGRVEEAALGK